MNAQVGPAEVRFNQWNVRTIQRLSRGELRVVVEENTNPSPWRIETLKEKGKKFRDTRVATTREMISWRKPISPDLLHVSRRARVALPLVSEHFWLFLPKTIPKIAWKSRGKFRDGWSRFGNSVLQERKISQDIRSFTTSSSYFSNLPIPRIRFTAPIICKCDA